MKWRPREGLPQGGAKRAGGSKVRNDDAMLSPAGALRLMQLFGDAQPPAPAVDGAPVQGAVARALKAPPFDLSALLEAQGYALVAPAYRPLEQQVEKVRDLAERAKGHVAPYVDAKGPLWHRFEWSPRALPWEEQLLESVEAHVASLFDEVDTCALVADAALKRASAMASEKVRAASWEGSVKAVVHAMAVAGCFGPKDGIAVAVSYDPILSDIAARLSSGTAQHYDLTLRRCHGNRRPLTHNDVVEALTAIH